MLLYLLLEQAPRAPSPTCGSCTTAPKEPAWRHTSTSQRRRLGTRWVFRFLQPRCGAGGRWGHDKQPSYFSKKAPGEQVGDLPGDETVSTGLWGPDCGICCQGGGGMLPWNPPMLTPKPVQRAWRYLQSAQAPPLPDRPLCIICISRPQRSSTQTFPGRSPPIIIIHYSTMTAKHTGIQCLHFPPAALLHPHVPALSGGMPRGRRRRDAAAAAGGPECGGERGGPGGSEANGWKVRPAPRVVAERRCCCRRRARVWGRDGRSWRQ